MLVQFVVDTTGVAEFASVRILTSTNPGFTRAAVAGLQTMLFQPAESRGQKLPQVVLLPFEFTIGPKEPYLWHRRVWPLADVMPTPKKPNEQ